MAEQEKKAGRNSGKDRGEALAAALQSLKGDHTPAAGEKWREFKNLRPEFDKAFKAGE